MAEPTQSGPPAPEVKPGSAPPPNVPPQLSKAQHAFRAMGLPNFRFKLPSRNWMIFLGITGSWTAALLYDRREKRLAQEKWVNLVSHLAAEPLPPQTMARKVTVVLSSPPGDGILTAREHFHEYVKPILVGAGLDWDVIEGRKEGDVRAGIAEKIRKVRKLVGEKGGESIDPEGDAEVMIAQMRAKSGIRAWPGVGGDLVVGRHSWKEYVRGLHEGWLGPLDPPPEPMSEPVPEPESPSGGEPDTTTAPFAADQPADSPDAAKDASANATDAPAAEEEKKKEEDAAAKKPKQPPPFISTISYPTASPAPSCPYELPPSTIIPFPHILGFLNTPTRMYRFLTRRHLADDVGRETAAIAMGAYRLFDQGPSGSSTAAAEMGSDSPVASFVSSDEDPALSPSNATQWEQQNILDKEEKEWHKSVRQRPEEDKEKESVWADPMVLDPRIAARMRRFALDAEEEARAERIRSGAEKARGAERTDEE
ncbi:hypothetical protein K402DRAFT_422634 [Aulographum hederae CBS 113979]|uniref:Mitochondrial import inner membrane translocase subunit TIM54 n=1 Tax=Aulographum hederae CBS 113979 TaxID=1176131 RepID=A0A6G1GUU0_9PEZI|nr:hypothetical protein K402DRAFT_422634 [Aulographum hederae CBS 113979]